jgi:crotonobetainyl-CoA:carnitine CoA-transferase CaiB-like acyl-CoA transferase
VADGAADPRGPLLGLRVLDLTAGQAGPLAGMMLADYGADVVRVERAGGDPALGQPGFLVWNRGKRRLTCDLDDDADRAGLAELLLAADVVLVGTSPGAITRDELQTRGLARGTGAYVVICPYLPSGTPWATGQESAALLFAAMGHSWGQAAVADVPVDCVFPVILCMQGIWAATIAVAAAYARARDGQPRTVHVGGAHAGVMVSPGSFEGRPQAQAGRPGGGPAGSLPNYRCYRCQDGQWVFLAAFSDRFIDGALSVLGLGSLLGDARLAGDPGRVRLEGNFAWLAGQIGERFGTRPRSEWLALFEQADVPLAPVLDSRDWLGHPQIRAQGLRAEAVDAHGRHLVEPGLPLRFSRTPGRVGFPPPGAPPRLAGAHPWPPPASRSPAPPPAPATATAQAPAPGAFLGGVRVLGFGTIIAGPYAATLLGELGAEVIKVERPPLGDDLRRVSGGRGRGGFGSYNRGQRAAAIDLGREPGRDAMAALVATADVLIDNFRPGVLARLGLDWATLSRARPGIVSASISAFGPDGPLGSRPGFDPVVQAMSGMMRTQAGHGPDAIPVFLNIPVNDVLAAALVAFGVCAALFGRGSAGLGQAIDVTLMAPSCLLQSGQLVEVDGERVPAEGGLDFAGPSPLSRFYQAADAWIRFDAHWPADLARFRSAGLLGDLPPECDGDPDLVTAALGQAVLRRPAAGVLRLARQAGVAAGVARTVAELAGDPALRRAGVIAAAGPDGRAIRPGRWFEVPGAGHQPPHEQRREVGADTRDVLRGLQLTEGHIAALFSSGAVTGA